MPKKGFNKIFQHTFFAIAANIAPAAEPSAKVTG